MRDLRRTASGGLLAIASVTACAATYDSLPAPAASYGEKQEYQLYLSVSVNGNILAGAVPVKVNAGHYWIAPACCSKRIFPCKPATRWLM